MQKLIKTIVVFKLTSQTQQTKLTLRGVRLGEADMTLKFNLKIPQDVQYNKNNYKSHESSRFV